MKELFKKYNLKDKEIDKIIFYVEELARWNEKINLVAKNDEKWIIEELIIPVILIRDWVKEGNIVEIGAGSGVVSVVLSILNNDAKFTLIERREKKCSFLRYVRKKIELKFNVLCKDAKEEDFKEAYDVLILRGVKILNWHFNIAKKIIYFGKIDGETIETKKYKNIFISLLKGKF